MIFRIRDKCGTILGSQHTPLNLPPEISKNIGIHTTSNSMACGLPLGAFGFFFWVHLPVLTLEPVLEYPSNPIPHHTYFPVMCSLNLPLLPRPDILVHKINLI